MTGVIEERFAASLRPGYFSRVDNQHPLELYIGLDEKGRKAIELRARFTARKVTGTSAIDVNQYKNEKYNSCDLVFRLICFRIEIIISKSVVKRIAVS